MNEAWRPAPGQVALIELDGADDCLTGVVLGSNGGPVTIDLGASPPPRGPSYPVLASFFAPDALYRVRGTAKPHGTDAVIDLSIDDIERVQRRGGPRSRVAVRAALTAFDEDGAFVSVVGETIDVSEGGCRIRTKQPFPWGRSPTVSLRLPDGDTLACSAEILQAESAHGRFEYRLAFLSLEPTERKQLAALSGG